LTLASPDDHDFRSVYFTVQGNTGSNAFTATTHLKLIPSPPYGIYKNVHTHTVEIHGVADKKLADDLH
jgi:hypothetical protein